MQRLNSLWQIVNAASTVRDMAQTTRTYHFTIAENATFYLRAEHADVKVIRWSRPVVEVMVRLQAAFGWRVAVEQDEAGVYMAAARRTVVGGLSSARFEVRVPYTAYVVLRLEPGSVQLDNVNGVLNLPPAGAPSEE
ncbi:MAG: hypothetical protein SF029_12620 [bacterium]|nr:hypothetical protein [bacterium]